MRKYLPFLLFVINERASIVHIFSWPDDVHRHGISRKRIDKFRSKSPVSANKYCNSNEYYKMIKWLSYVDTMSSYPQSQLCIGYSMITVRQHSHDDVIKWKHFPRHWPFARGIHRSSWIPRTKASDAELWCFLWSAPEYLVGYAIVRRVIWDAIALIMTSLECALLNDSWGMEIKDRRHPVVVFNHINCSITTWFH